MRNEEKLEKKNYTRYFKFPGIDYLRPDNFKKLLEKRFYSMKNILFDIIEIIRDNRFVNVFGDKLKFRGKVKMCEEVCKYFYMNNYSYFLPIPKIQTVSLFIISRKYF